MRTFVIHDATGKVLSAGVPGVVPEGDLELVATEAQAKEGARLAVVDADDATAGKVGFGKRFRIDPGTGSLVARPDAPK